MLVCLDPTRNEKLEALVAAFERAGGEAYVGDGAWNHLEASAGEVMSIFLERYVRGPLQTLITEASADLFDFRATARADRIEISIGSETLRIQRTTPAVTDDDGDEMPEDADNIVPGT